MKHFFPILTLLLSGSFLHAQRVLYSPVIDSRNPVRMAGKAGDYYWVVLNQSARRMTGPSFSVFDGRMRWVRNLRGPRLTDHVLKEYLLGGDQHFDEVLITEDYGTIQVSLLRNSADGIPEGEGRRLFRFPFVEPGNSFLLARSADRQKILLLGFESRTESTPRLHALLFDADWNLLYERKFESSFLSQPFIQDDFLASPAESFSNLPLKLSNDGQWLMLAPSRTSTNFLLFHFPLSDSSFQHTEISLPATSRLEDLALSVDDANELVYAGILSTFRYVALKNAEVVRYSLLNHRVEFDSSYRFSTLLGAQVKADNLIHEFFMAWPGRGFILLKEYGRDMKNDQPAPPDDDPFDLESLFVGNAISNNWTAPIINPDGYTRYGRLGGTRSIYDRGDLSIFYLPAFSRDSCWTGIINKEQRTELNSPYLSYLPIPEGDGLFFLYNSTLNNEEQYGSTTVLDSRGILQSGGEVAFWRYADRLNFQDALQIAAEEVAVPYAGAQGGYAIIRF